MLSRSVRMSVAMVGVMALGLTACGDADDSASSPNTSSSAPATTQPAGDGLSDANSSSDVATAELSPVLTEPIVFADGSTSSLSDLLGDGPLFVENFATWCSNCREQLKKTQQAAVEAGSSATFIALSVETTLGADDMSDYANDNKFDNIRFAVMSPKMLAAVDDALGKSALNPPSTPTFVVSADGSIGELATGSESVADILRRLDAVR